MKTAKDFRQIARDNLRGHWGIAVVAGLLASLLGVSDSNFSFNFNINSGSSSQYDLNAMFAQLENSWPEIFQIFMAFINFVVVALLVLSVILFFLCSIISLGYRKFHLDLYDPEKTPSLGTIFRYFPHWKVAVLTRLRSTLIIFLWTLLFFIPGIIATYSYAMTDFILAENPGLTPKEAMARSKALMAGNRWRLFCLEFSFIGWAFLCLFTLGIGALWLEPYVSASTTAFYRDLVDSQPAWGTEYL